VACEVPVPSIVRHGQYFVLRPEAAYSCCSEIRKHLRVPSESSV